MGRGEVVGLYYREQKHICGKDYDTAPYMEVDLYPVSAKKHKASRRAKKKEASSLAQQTYNDNRAKRYHVQLVNTKCLLSYINIAVHFVKIVINSLNKILIYIFRNK
jgi:hypothetical protein